MSQAGARASGQRCPSHPHPLIPGTTLVGGSPPWETYAQWGLETGSPLVRPHFISISSDPLLSWERVAGAATPAGQEAHSFLRCKHHHSFIGFAVFSLEAGGRQRAQTLEKNKTIVSRYVCIRVSSRGSCR